MNKTLILFKTMFKSEDIMEIGGGKTGGKIKGIFKIIGLMLILLLAGISFAPLIVELYKPLQSIGMRELPVSSLKTWIHRSLQVFRRHVL